METKWNSVWKCVFKEGTETQSCLCVVPFPMCPSVVKVSGDCSSDRALECKAVWTECTQMCCGHMHSFNREERTVVLAVVGAVPKRLDPVVHLQLSPGHSSGDSSDWFDKSSVPAGFLPQTSTDKQ